MGLSRKPDEQRAMTSQIQKHKQYLLTGVSYVVPFIACGGILLAVSMALVPMGEAGPDFDNAPTLRVVKQIGEAAFGLYLPVLAGFIAFAIAGRPGLVPGMIGGWFCGIDLDGVPGPPVASAGFLGAIVIGLVAGHFVNLFKVMPTHRFIRPVMPILIIPVIGALAVGLLMLKFLGAPIAGWMTDLNAWLSHMNDGNKFVFAAVLGGMIAFDMGGPINKAAFFFGATMLQQGNPTIMGPIAAAICTPPLGLGLATLMRRNIWSDAERDSGVAAIGMGMIGITEGAIPFAAADPFRVIPCIVLGSMTAAVVAMAGGVGDHAPHGGPIVLPVVDNRYMFIMAIIAGTLVTTALVIGAKSLSRRSGESA